MIDIRKPFDEIAVRNGSPHGLAIDGSASPLGTFSVLFGVHGCALTEKWAGRGLPTTLCYAKVDWITLWFSPITSTTLLLLCTLITSIRLHTGPSVQTCFWALGNQISIEKSLFQSSENWWKGQHILVQCECISYRSRRCVSDIVFFV